MSIRRLCAGLLRVLVCAGQATEIHIFGFNWSAKHYFTHQMASEQLIVRQLAKGFNITVHATACASLRSCEALCDGPEYQFAKEGEGEECRKKCAPCHGRRVIQPYALKFGGFSIVYQRVVLRC